VAQPDGVPQEAWIRLGAVQEIVRTPNSPYFTATQKVMRAETAIAVKSGKNIPVSYLLLSKVGRITGLDW